MLVFKFDSEINKLVCEVKHPDHDKSASSASKEESKVAGSSTEETNMNKSQPEKFDFIRLTSAEQRAHIKTFKASDTITNVQPPEMEGGELRESQGGP